MFNDRIYIDAFVFSAPLFILLIYSIVEIFDEFKFTYFRKSIHKINLKSDIIKELCYCKLNNIKSSPDSTREFNCLEYCPILKNISMLEDHKYIEEKNNYPYLTLEDIKDVSKLAIKLKDSKDKLSEYILTNSDELQEVLDEYVGDIKNSKNLRQSLKEKNPGRIRRAIIELRRFIIVFLLGEWHPSSRSSSKKMSKFYKNFAHPSDMEQRLAYNLCIILNRDILYSTCHYEEGKFLQLDAKLKKQDKSLLKAVSNSEKSPEKCVQLNRLVLESYYRKEISCTPYMNHLWGIIKKKLVLGAKQSQYFDMAAVQFLLLGLISFYTKANVIYIFVLIGMFFLLVNFKESENPFGWFKNRFLRFTAVFFVWLLGYLYYLNNLAGWIEK